MLSHDSLRAALAGRYTLERELGAGGMATVYLAQDLRHERKVALKILREELSASLGKERFLREIKVAAALQHPHILPLYDSGAADNLLYYVMPYVDGPSLRDKLAKEGELPIGEAVRILRDVADALTEAHRHGVVHRDLKPENVMLRGRHALVMDFGVAKALSEATGRQSLTSVGVALGTPAYMAPEQAAADPLVDHRADLYAFGVVAYELLAGRPPFTGATPQQVLAAHVTAAPEPIATYRPVAPALAALVMRCLEKRPADRWQTAEELIPQLEALLTPSGGITPTATRPVAAAAPRSSRRLALGIALGALLVLLGLGTWLVSHRRPAGASPSGPAAVTSRRVGVLPFASRSRDTADAYLGDGMATDLTTTLAGMSGLHVVSRSSAFALRGKTAREAGTALSADAMVEGTVGKVDGRLRVTVSLVNVADEAMLWSQRYDVTEKELYPLQDSAAAAIASALGVGLARRADAGLAAHRTANPEAHDLVLRGQFLTEQSTEAGLHEAIALFQRAAALDSTYAEPWNGIAQAWFFLADTYLAPRAAVPPMQAAVEKALALDPTSAAAHALHASVLNVYLRDYAAADREYLRAIALDSTTPFGGDYGGLLHARGLDDSALAVMRRARRHNPFSYGPMNLNVILFGDLGMLDSATAVCQALRRLASDPCDEWLLLRRGRAAEIIAARKATPATKPEDMMRLAEALARAGDAVAARRQLSAALSAAGTRYVREDGVAGAYLALGDTSRALEWLDRGLAAQAANMSQINRAWRFQPLHGNPAFAAIVRKAGLQLSP
ncbi:MAG TPA: serine/threonine-protein kinase [Gemmatimonadales bacterium]|nr:serine/threonine-protein kinase [Gemmatimonadales bacterium]